MENPVADKMVTTTCVKCGNVIDVTGLDPGDSITCPYCANEFAITRQFGNFVLERQVGSGGMGAVYMGHDVTLNRVVAVKVLKPELVSDKKFLDTFLREAEITASLNHPNIVQVYAFGQHEGVYYMVVEYISGGTLDDKIAERGQITELEGIEIGIAVARGLECALQRGGLIHRDIKSILACRCRLTPRIISMAKSGVRPITSPPKNWNAKRRLSKAIFTAWEQRFSTRCRAVRPTRERIPTPWR